MKFLPFFLLLFVSLSYSQDLEVPAISGVNLVPDGVDEPNHPSNSPKSASVGTELGDTLIQENIEQPKLSGNDLADLYRKYTGRRVIVASSATQAEFQFVQPASPTNPLTYRQAAELLKKAATIENFIFVPDATDPTLDFLTLATAGLKPSSRGVKVYTETDTFPEGDEVISYVMSFGYIKPDEAVRIFVEIIGQIGAFGSISAVPNTGSIVITENTSLIRKLIDLKAQIDKPSSQVETRFITVRYADVTELATTVQELLGKQQESNTTAGVQRAAPRPIINQVEMPNVPLPNSNPSAGSASGSAEASPLHIVPDARTNRIFAMGRPADIVFVESLIRQFDTESDQRNSYSRKLKFLAVVDFLPIAGDALTRAFTGIGEASTTGAGAASQAAGGAARTNNQSQSNANSGGGNNFGDSSMGNGSGNSGSRGGGSGGSSGGNALSDPQVNSAPESLLVGRTMLVADNINNSILVQGPPTAVEIIDQLLDQIDVKAEQVMISTVFGQLNLKDETTTGVNWLKAFRGNGNGGIAASSVGGGVLANAFNPSNLDIPSTGTGTNNFPNIGGLTLYGKIGNSLASYVSLISESSDFTVLSRPSIFAANNRKGSISSGRRIAVPTNSNQFGGTNGVSTNIEYRDVVLKLEVIPLVNSENEITLQIAVVSDDVIDTETITGVGNVPIIGTRELQTTVTVPNNQTIVLGGLITSNNEDSKTGIPILKDIPGLGRLFSTNRNNLERNELMIFIQPSIVKSSGDLKSTQDRMDSFYDVSDPAREFGDQDLLPTLNPATPVNAAPAKKVKAQKNTRPPHRP